MMKKTVLLYHFDETELPKVRRALLPLKFRIRAVGKEEYSYPIGVLAGVDEADENGYPAHTEEFGRLVVMGGLLSVEIDKVILGLRKAGFGREVLKAVITPTNRGWNAFELYREIHREHEQLSGGAK